MFKKILVVDDSELIHNLMHLALKKLGNVPIIDAHNGAEAWHKVTGDPDIELILLDINMPIMDGVTLLKQIRQHREFDRIKIVMVTTEGEEKDTLTCLQSGANAYITKPFKPLDLMTVFKRIAPAKGG